MITVNDFNNLFPNASMPASQMVDSLNKAMLEFQINTISRQSMFLAQVAHESGGFHWTEELWGPTDAQRRYEGRLGLGNIQAGDGYRFRGRGLIQLTGRANYHEFGDKLSIPLEQNPDLATQPSVLARLAACFWQTRGCNQTADTGNFVGITHIINGGENGQIDREDWLRKIKPLIMLDTPAPISHAPRVFLTDTGGKNVPWDGQTTEYGGVIVSAYSDGAIQLTRAPKKDV